MDEAQFKYYLKIIHDHTTQLSQIVSQKEETASHVEAIAIALEHLQLLSEETQTGIEASKVVEEELLEQVEVMALDYQQYYDLFHSAPDAYLIADINGVITNANAAAATLLNVSRQYLIGKPLSVFVAQSERRAFRTQLNQLSHLADVQLIHDWETVLCPTGYQPIAAALSAVVIPARVDQPAMLHLSIRDIRRYKLSDRLAEPRQERLSGATLGDRIPASLPPALDGLRVLVVDDEIDARQLITAILESHGIEVTAVSSGEEAIASMLLFRPDVLLCDVRMPDEDGYALIRRIRELEESQGRHVPAAAFTAYQAENRNKALQAGFEEHLHKLAQPAELLEMVARLSGRRSR